MNASSFSCRFRVVFVSFSCRFRVVFKFTRSSVNRQNGSMSKRINTNMEQCENSFNRVKEHTSIK